MAKRFSFDLQHTHTHICLNNEGRRGKTGRPRAQPARSGTVYLVDVFHSRPYVLLHPVVFSRLPVGRREEDLIG